MNMELLKSRVKGKVKFVYFAEQSLWYECNDTYVFPVPVADTKNESGGGPTFLAEDKAIFFMRWIRKSMEVTDDTGTDT